jgi:Ca2+-binding RTX toxin-like protein
MHCFLVPKTAKNCIRLAMLHKQKPVFITSIFFRLCLVNRFTVFLSTLCYLSSKIRVRWPFNPSIQTRKHKDKPMTTIIRGTAQNDTLTSTGQQDLYGGAGDDIYIISSSTDRAIEVEEVYYGSNGKVTRVSTTSTGAEAQGDSFFVDSSADGRYVLFGSGAPNLSEGDTNRWYDLFVKDQQTGQVTLVSKRNDQLISNGYSYDGKLSQDGSKVVFVSDASNLVEQDTNQNLDVFVKDLKTGAIQQLGQPLTGQVDGYIQNVSFSQDGKWIGFVTSSNGLVADDQDSMADVFIQSLDTLEIKRISQTPTGVAANGGSARPVFSPDGRSLIFYSYATNLSNTPTETGTFKVYRYDLQTGQIECPIIGLNGAAVDRDTTFGNLSPDGKKLVFISTATNLVANLSPNDQDLWSNVFVLDLPTGQIQQVNVTPTGQGTIGDGFTWSAHFTPDSQSVVFSAYDPLLPQDNNNGGDIYQRNLTTGALTLLSTDAQGVVGNQNSWAEHVSADGRTLFFSSSANNLVSDDTNDSTDVFAKTLSARINQGGIDTVISHVDYRLGDGLENLTLQGTAVIGYGNGLYNTLKGNALDNTLYGGAGNDQLYGDSGNDKLYGGSGNDKLYGGNGNDQLSASSGNDTLYGGANNDRLQGDAGNDTLYGGSGSDTLYGGLGDDKLQGDSSNDALYGGDGNDQLNGGIGQDRLYGGTGADEYGFARGHGQDIINDLDQNANVTDLLRYYTADVTYDQLWFSKSNQDLVVSIIGTTDSVTIQQWFSSTAQQIEHFSVHAGQSLDSNDVQQLVQAMAGLTPPSAGQTTLSAAQQTALHSTFALTWLN